MKKHLNLYIDGDILAEAKKLNINISALVQNSLTEAIEDMTSCDSTKRCYICGCTKPLNNFNKNKAKKDGYQNYCKCCSKKMQEHYYSEKRTKMFDLSHRLKVNGCAICGYNSNIHALEFHHCNPSIKRFSLSIKGLSKYNNEQIVEEIQKCILLCSNCHREIERNK